MKQVVFPQKKVANFLSSHFVPLSLDIDNKLPKGFSYIGVPTFFIVSKDGKKLNMIIGGNDAKRFLKILIKKLKK